jgi:DNA-binding NarL/FixJ family response regulator
MLKCQNEEMSILGICVNEPLYSGAFPAMTVTHASTGRQALSTLHMLNVDFVLVGMELPDMMMSDFLQTMRMHFPQAKWALVGERITEEEEIIARTMGATTLFDAVPSTYEIHEIVAHQRRHAARRVLAGRSEMKPVVRSLPVPVAKPFLGPDASFTGIHETDRAMIAESFQQRMSAGL